MKKSIIIIGIILISLPVVVHAQLVVDDFSTGNLNNKSFEMGKSEPFYQTGNKILKEARRIHVNVRQDLYKQSLQLAIQDGFMVISSSYDTRGKVFLAYGYDNNGNKKPMDLDVSSYKSLKIEFEAKSTDGGIYVGLFTKSDRAVYSTNVAAREGEKTVEISLDDFKVVGQNFSFEHVDYIRLQFGSSSKTGCNMAVNKIWFE